MISRRHASSRGMNSAPTAYCPGSGSLKPSSAAFLAKNLCGVCTKMPAPSPARGSAPTAPRCSRLTRMVSASSTILCDLRPLMSAINPTPQESFSSAGSNRPKPDALISSHSPPWPACCAAAPAQPILRRLALPARTGDQLILEATFVPLKGLWLLFRRLRRALALPAADPRAPPPAFPRSGGEKGGMAARNAGHQLGQQCCPMPNMANSRRQHKGGALARATKRSVLHRSGADSCHGPRASVDHGNRMSAMVDRAAAASGDIEGDRLGDGLTGILRLQVIFAARYARTRNLGRTAAAFAQCVAWRGSIFPRDLVDEHDRGACRHIRVGHADAVRGLADVVEGWHRDILVTISGGCECVMST